jgi:hypothetical protein
MSPLHPSGKRSRQKRVRQPQLAAQSSNLAAKQFLGLRRRGKAAALLVSPAKNEKGPRNPLGRDAGLGRPPKHRGSHRLHEVRVVSGAAAEATDSSRPTGMGLFRGGGTGHTRREPIPWSNPVTGIPHTPERIRSPMTLAATPVPAAAEEQQDHYDNQN